MRQRHTPRLALALLAATLAACGGSDEDLVERHGLQFRYVGASEDRYFGPFMECLTTSVGYYIESSSGQELPSDLVVDRVVVSRADGSEAWAPSIRPAMPLQEGNRLLVGSASDCSQMLSGERLNSFPRGSMVTITVHLAAGGLRGRLRENEVPVTN